jgi:hypothetical protein
MREAAGARQDDIGLVVEGADHAPHEGGVQERRIGGGGEGHLGAAVEGAEARGQPLQRPAPLARVLDDLDAAGQGGQRLPGRAHHDDGTVDAARHDPGNAAQQSGPVPLQGRLGRPHAGGTPACEHDSGGRRHARDATRAPCG